VASEQRCHRCRVENVVLGVKPLNSFVRFDSTVDQQHDSASKAVQGLAINDGLGWNQPFGAPLDRNERMLFDQTSDFANGNAEKFAGSIEVDELDLRKNITHTLRVPQHASSAKHLKNRWRYPCK